MAEDSVAEVVVEEEDMDQGLKVPRIKERRITRR